MLGFIPIWLVPIIAAIVVALLVFMLSGYVKASPDEALILSGLHAKPRVLIGRAGFKIPFFERVDRLCLKQISVDIKTDQFIPTNDFINVRVDAVAKVRVTEDPDGMLLAERNFLNMREADIAASLQDSLQGNMREIIGTLDLKSINTDRDSFSDQVMAKASRDMEKLGIEILSCNIQNVTDEHGLINDLGMDNTSKIKKDASIAKAKAEKEVAVAQAEADREANEARVAADQQIAQRQNELAIKQAQLKAVEDTERAKADAAYHIQEQEQRRTVLEAETRAKAESVRVREQELDAEVRKQAEADKYKEIQSAEARMEAQKRAAEAQVYAAEQEAKAIRLRGEAEAEAARARGLAEAEAARAKGEAEAAALEKRAEALQKMNQAGMAEMMIKILPEMAAAVASPLSTIDHVSIYGGAEGGSGISQISGAMPTVIKQVFDTMSDATGVDMRDVLRAGTIDAATQRNIHVDGDLGGVEVDLDDVPEE
ncbi:MAG: SPFH domain-containing protein [Coriobacteriales bacterium]|nr:SPFH domain-containing protein [Coriobacteriales bacterium]